jgi:hypothetical protein
MSEHPARVAAAARGHRGRVVGRAPGDGHVVRLPSWSRRGIVMAVVVAPVVLIGGGVLVGRLAEWSWASAIFLGVVAYILAIQAAWVVTGAIAVRRELQLWRGSYDWEQERRVP